MRLLSCLWSEYGVNVLELYSNIRGFIANHALHGNQTAVHNFGVLRTLPQNCSPPFGPMSLALCEIRFCALFLEFKFRGSVVDYEK